MPKLLFIASNTRLVVSLSLSLFLTVNVVEDESEKSEDG